MSSVCLTVGSISAKDFVISAPAADISTFQQTDSEVRSPDTRLELSDSKQRHEHIDTDRLKACQQSVLQGKFPFL